MRQYPSSSYYIKKAKGIGKDEADRDACSCSWIKRARPASRGGHLGQLFWPLHAWLTCETRKPSPLHQPCPCRRKGAHAGGDSESTVPDCRCVGASFTRFPFSRPRILCRHKQWRVHARHKQCPCRPLPTPPSPHQASLFLLCRPETRRERVIYMEG